MTARSSFFSTVVRPSLQGESYFAAVPLVTAGRITPLIARHISGSTSTMAPPKSALQFLDFVNASPTRKWLSFSLSQSLNANTSRQPTTPALQPPAS
jgi:hypothetical protein